MEGLTQGGISTCTEGPFRPFRRSGRPFPASHADILRPEANRCPRLAVTVPQGAVKVLRAAVTVLNGAATRLRTAVTHLRVSDTEPRPGSHAGARRRHATARARHVPARGGHAYSTWRPRACAWPSRSCAWPARGLVWITRSRARRSTCLDWLFGSPCRRSYDASSPRTRWYAAAGSAAAVTVRPRTTYAAPAAAASEGVATRAWSSALDPPKRIPGMSGFRCSP